MAQVLLKKISKKYPAVDKPAVDAVDIEARDKEFLVLVGPSGCGKSTTLRLVAGLEEATSGDIYIGERRVNDVAPKDRDIAMIFQNYALYPHMSVYQNMAFPLKMRKFARAEIDRRVREAAQMLEITPYLDRKPKALSGGQRQRVAVGRAIVRKPQVFLFDEPLSNLDAKMRVVMRTEISALHRRLESTMIYVTHDQVEAMTMGDRIVVMHDGRVQQIDDPKTIYERPRNQFVAGFIGSPPMNFIPGRLVQESDVLYFDEGSWRIVVPEAYRTAMIKYNEGQIVLGLRPEDFSEPSPHALPGPQITAKVEIKEPLGAETIFYMASANSKFIARLGRDAVGEIGEDKLLQIAIHRAHFFDSQTQQRIDEQPV